MKKIKYPLLTLVGFIVTIIQSIVFGIDSGFETPLELHMATAGLVMIVWGIAGDILSNVTWQKSTHISVMKEDLAETIKSI